MRHSREVLRDRVVTIVVRQRVGDAEQIAYSVLIETADLEIPIVVEFMLQLDETCIGDEICSSARLAQTQLRRIERGGEYRREKRIFLSTEIDDAARQASSIGFIVTEIGFDHGSIGEIEIDGSARQRPVGRTLGRPAFAFAVNDVESVANFSVRRAPSDVD